MIDIAKGRYWDNEKISRSVAIGWIALVGLSIIMAAQLREYIY